MLMLAALEADPGYVDAWSNLGIVYYEERDLDVTTDFRDVLGELVIRHLGNARIGDVFPGYDQPRFRGIVAG